MSTFLFWLSITLAGLSFAVLGIRGQPVTGCSLLIGHLVVAYLIQTSQIQKHEFRSRRASR